MRPREADMSEWRMQSLAEEAGLIRQEVNDICFDTNGTAWIAASDGLYRYDGYKWKVYSTKDGFPSSFVRSVLFTRSGKLWVGTDKGAGVFDGQRFAFNGADKGLAGPSVVRMYEDPDGTIWFCSDTWPDASAPSGLTSLSPEGRWTVYRESDGLPTRHVFSYFRSATGEQFVMTGGGVAVRCGNRWLAVTNMLEVTEESPAPAEMAELPGVGPVCIYKGCLMDYHHGEWRAMSGKVFPLQDIPGFGPVHLPWIVSDEGEFLNISSSGNKYLRICRWNGTELEPISPPITRPVMVNYMVEAPDGSIWCGGASLLERWDRHGGEWKEFVHLPPPRSVEKDGGVLFSDGMRAYVLRGNAFDPVNDYQDAGNPSSVPSGWRIVSGQAWRIQEGKIVQEINTIPSGIQQGQLLIQDRKGLVWFVGADAEGKTRISVNTGVLWQRINAPQLLGYELMRSDGRITHGGFISSALTPDPKGGIWLAFFKPDDPNVLVCNLTTTQVKIYPLNYPRLGSLVLAPDGQVFACGSAGTFKLNFAAAQWQPVVEIAGHLIRSAVQRGQELWCLSDAITGGKFAISLYLQGKWTHYFLPVTDYLGKTEDGTVYFASKDCLFFIPANSIGPPRRLTILEGHQPASVVKDRQGRLWIGLADTDDDSVLCYTPSGMPPHTFIDDTPNTLRFGTEFRPVVEGCEYYVPPKQKRTYLYSWRFDFNPWTSFQEFPAEGVTSRGLSPGNHVFQIRAQDEGGGMDPGSAWARLVVLPIPLQEREWFKPAMVGIFTIILGLSIAAATQARRSAILYGDLFSNAPVAYHELDRRRRIRRVNDTELRLLGFSRHEMIGHQIGEFIMNENAEKFLAEKLAESHMTAATEWSFRRKDGTILPVLMEDRLIKRRDGSIVGIRSTLQDITIRKRAEEELLQAHKELSETHSQLKVLNEQLKQNIGTQIIARQQAETEFAVLSAERNRVARELHDTLEQTLAGIALRLDAIKELIDTNPLMARSYLESASEILRQSQTEVRRTVWGLRALALEKSDLAEALATVAQQISECAGIQVKLQIIGPRTRIPKDAENHLLRIGQEAIANALKHGHAKLVVIRLVFEPSRLLMTIEDDGCGFDYNRLAERGKFQSGLLGMNARLYEMGGELDVKTAPGAGTKIEVSISLDIKESWTQSTQLG